EISVSRIQVILRRNIRSRTLNHQIPVIGAHARRVITGFGSDPVHLFAFQVDAKNMLFEHWFEGRNKQRLPFFIKSNNSINIEITFRDLTDQLAVGFIPVEMIETISVAVPEKIS